jgi:hypothetical protein
MRTWYGPPIQIANEPGKGPLFAHKGGDFTGQSLGGEFCSFADWAFERIKGSLRRWSLQQASQLNAGFTGFSDLISEATAGGKRREYAFFKTGSTMAAGSCSTLWRNAGQPSAGAAASNAPGGNAPTKTTAGALFNFDNPTGGDFQFLVSAFPHASVATSTLFLYDRIFEVNKTMSSSATEAVTGVPSRYQSTTSGAVDSAEGNFLFIEAQAALNATAHNWTVCTYVNQAGTAGQTLPSVTGISSAIINRLDMGASTTVFNAPLAVGDTGIQKLTQMQCSSAALTGTIAFVIGHPLAWFPIPISFVTCPYDGINSHFSMPRIFDDAAMAFLAIQAGSTATNYHGTLVTVRG